MASELQILQPMAASLHLMPLLLAAIWQSTVWGPPLRTPNFVSELRGPVVGVVSSSYGMRHHPIFGHRSHHGGVDIAAPGGTPVRAAMAGVVRRVRWAGGYGLLIEIDHGLGWRTRYAHLWRAAVTSGARVERGAVIGLVGATGQVTGPHLHFELHYGDALLDPLPFFFAAR